MFKRLWKSISLVLTLALVLAGCSSSSSTNSKKEMITFMSWAGGGEKASLERAVKKFNETHPDIQVKLQTVTNDEYDTKLNALIAAGNPPDAGYVHETNAIEWGEKGILEDLEPYFAKDSSIKPDDYIGLYRNLGKTYGIALGQEIILLYYNKELFKEAGITPPSADPNHPWTWDQFVDAAKKLTVDVKGNHPSDSDFNPDQIKTYGTMIGTNWITLEPLLLSNGGGYLSRDGKDILFNKPESLEVFQKVADLSYKYHVAPSPQKASTLPSATVMVQNKQLAMYMNGNWDNATFGENGYQPGYAAVPIFKKPANIIFGASTSLFSKSKHKEAAWEFLRYLANPNSMNSMYADSVWIPPMKSWYSEQDKLKIWTDNKRHSGNYNQVVLPSVLNNISSLPNSLTIKNYGDMAKYFDDVTEKIYGGDGKVTAEDAMKDFKSDKVSELLNGAYDFK
ncbi:sugar ABC transporter substrate-binding protein [Bacillus sp. ISL-18]|uniref:ABC transporter substrate-binding protein n=1 Tax=Bacillus sp. ISL-18 TaxID=2819118 RepID=UPI001BEA9C04|nr:sugar ABC transporter substrate-binding protein [Bacillus sp. ISL-18]MBT2659030.1 sugar ABC transporter substrate-binding protein [Bacillus sp. ISL-18]